MWCCLHGFLGAPSMWTSVTASLSGPVVTPSLTGHGPEPDLSATTFQGEVQRLLQLLEDADRPRYLCGYSMGARIGLGMLIAAPDRFDAAVLISGHAGLDADERPARCELDRTRANRLVEHGLPAFVEEWESLPLFASQRDLDPAVFVGQREMRLGHDPTSLGHALRVLGAGEMPDYRPRLAEIQTPVTFVAGSLDDRYVATATEMASAMPNALCHIIANTGHNPVLERPIEVESILADQEAV